jgi:hypothetical protein
MYREGLVLGFSLGGGTIATKDCPNVCGGAGMGEFHLGAMMNPRLALMGDFWLGARTFNDPTLGTGSMFNSISTLALQYWVTDIIWLKGGAGFGRRQVFVDDSSGTFSTSIDDRTAPALMGAVGLEIVQAFNFALDLQFRVGTGFYSDISSTNVAFMVGFNWY